MKACMAVSKRRVMNCISLGVRSHRKSGGGDVDGNHVIFLLLATGSVIIQKNQTQGVSPHRRKDGNTPHPKSRRGLAKKGKQQRQQRK